VNLKSYKWAFIYSLLSLLSTLHNVRFWCGFLKWHNTLFSFPGTIRPDFSLLYLFWKTKRRLMKSPCFLFVSPSMPPCVSPLIFVRRLMVSLWCLSVCSPLILSFSILSVSHQRKVDSSSQNLLLAYKLGRWIMSATINHCINIPSSRTITSQSNMYSPHLALKILFPNVTIWKERFSIQTGKICL
jgi:hypothetical protein